MQIACARLSVSGDEQKSGRAAKKQASEKRQSSLSPAPTRFSRQFDLSIRFSEYLGAWNRPGYRIDGALENFRLDYKYEIADEYDFRISKPLRSKRPRPFLLLISQRDKGS